jgi:hypothetical protein
MNLNSSVGVKKKIFTNLINVPGKSTSGKYLLFQSDDWGSERMPSKAVFDKLSKKSWINLDKCPYTKFDTLEHYSDLERLGNVLNKYKDKSNKNPVFTLNYNVSNPDFEGIKLSGFEDYNHISCDISYKKNNKGNVLDLVFNGINSQIFEVQYHGKQHFHIGEYMNLLRIKDSTLAKVFNDNMYALSFVNAKDILTPYLATYYPFPNFDRVADYKEGVAIFKGLFNTMPTSFIAPVYIWNDELEKVAIETGASIIQGLYFRNDFELNFRGKKEYRFSNNHSNAVNLIRNCFFEPSTYQNYDWISNCLYEIEAAFRFNKPAIISSHRLNYMSGIFQENAEKGLKMLDLLLAQIIKRWPDVNFVTTNELSKLYDYDKK